MNKSRLSVALILLVLLAVGAWLRLVQLHYPTMGGDVMEFYKICQAGIRPGELLVNSPKYIGGMPPFWFAAHNGFLQTFGLEVNFTNARLPDAITGILTILIAFGAGRAAGGKRIGLLTALFVALQPLHIQMSRECYFYVPIVLGGFLALWALLRLAARIDRRQSPGTGFYLLTLSGFLLLTHVQISSWSFALVWLLAIYALLLPEAVRKRMSWGPVIGLTIGFFLLGLPTLLSEWGMHDVLTLLFGESKDHWENVFGEQKRDLLTTAWHILSAYLTGRGLLRSLASALLLAAGAAALALSWKRERMLRIFAWFSGAAFVLLAAMHSLSIFPAENRHYASLFPILALWSSMGLVRLGEAAAARLNRPAFKQALSFGLPALLVAGLFSHPAWLSSQVDAHIPYARISEWTDRHLPPGTVVLCDRWFTPWNEFRMNPSTNVTYTFTVPSEPIQTYSENRWRDTVKEFLAVNPRAAYFESKTYWTRLGPWTWPHGQFARKQEFVDPAAVRLDTLGLYYRAWLKDFPREWVPVTLYYNTEEDLADRARQAGRPLLVLFGSGWAYHKPWQVRGDFRDWYVLQESASVLLHNLTDTPLRVFLDVTGAAVPGAVTVTAFAGANAVFQPQQLQTQRLGPLELAPGRHEIQLRNLTRTQPPAALLVQRLAASAD
jgi:hypothetical protein